MNKRSRWLWLGLFLPLLPWIITSNDFTYPRYSEFSDLTITHLPNAIFLINSLKSNGSIPLWSDLIFGGYPFAANPLAGLWYPPGWLAYIFPLPLGFNLLVMLHLLWGAIGFKRYLDHQNLREEASLLGAFAFLLMPKIFAHYAAGHITLIYAVCWTPWLIFNHTANKRNTRWLISAAILGLIALADVRWLAYSVLLWGGLILGNFFHLRKNKQFSLRANLLIEIPTVLVVAISLAAVLLVPLVEYTLLSTRVLMDVNDLSVNSLPIEELLGLWIPDFGGFAEWVLYPGAVLFCLGIYGLTIPCLRGKTASWLLVVFLSLLLSMGKSLPFYSFFSALPGMDLLRVPTRFYFLGGMGLAIIAANGLNDLLERENVFRPDPVFFMTPFAAFTGFLGVGFMAIGQSVPANLVWGLISMSACVILIAVLERNKSFKAKGALVLLIFLVFDLSVVNYQSIRKEKSEEVFSESQPIVEFLNAHSGYFRIYTPSYSIPQHIAAIHQIKMVNGVDPLILRSYQSFFVKASGVPIYSYSVTLPPFPNNDPKRDNQNFSPDLELLSLLGVRFVLSEFELPSLIPYQVARFSETRIYENPYYLGLAWLEINDEKSPVGSLEIEANRISVRATGPGQLFISHIHFPGWVAFMDGLPVNFTQAYELFPVFSLPEGDHFIQLEFKPKFLTIGLVISVVAWLVVIFLLFINIVNEKK